MLGKVDHPEKIQSKNNSLAYTRHFGKDQWPAPKSEIAND
jgi:hypothetical protein